METRKAMVRARTCGSMDGSPILSAEADDLHRVLSAEEGRTIRTKVNKIINSAGDALFYLRRSGS
jgi:hypothetical protein